jgi:hypothetical protein
MPTLLASYLDAASMVLLPSFIASGLDDPPELPAPF